MNPPESASSRSIVSSAVLVAAVPGLAYGLAFIFEAGYLHHFGLPSWIIRLDISNVFVAIAGLLFVGWLLYWLVLTVPIRFLAVGRWLNALLGPFLLSWLTYAGVRFALRHQSLSWWLWPLIGFVGVLGTFYAFVVEPIRALPAESSWTQRLRVAQRKVASEGPDSIFDASLKSLAKQGYDVRWFLFGGLGVLLLAQITYLAGER